MPSLPRLLLALALTGRLLAQTPPVSPTATPAEPKPPAIENSVVKIFSTVQYPDAYKPWTRQAPTEQTGTGAVIEGKRILTNAHVVLYAKEVQVQAHQSGDRLSATVEFISPGIDLAVLKLEDESFFDTHAPLTRSRDLPQIKDTVLAYGYPTGGNSLSITKGIVSRIEFAPYNYPMSGLRIQIDAAINPGNSGGPALVGDRMIGLAFSRLGGGDNIGYIIPNEEIDLFLADVRDGQLDGKPAIFDQFQKLENTALRAFLRLDKSVEGIAVLQPESGAADYPLKTWDVITHIGGTRIDNEGMIKLGDNLRVFMQYEVQRIVQDGRVPLTLLRDGKEMKVTLPVPVSRPLLLADLRGNYPSYFIYGPMVFSAATAQFIGGVNNVGFLNLLAAHRSPLISRRGDKPAFDGEQLVVVPSPFFPHRLVKGYGPPTWQVVESVNGTAVKNLRHLVEILRDSPDEFLRFSFAGANQETLVFRRKELADATEGILNDNGVRAQGSPVTMEAWNAKPATARP
jgi:S1-C subfamily serine protease